MKSWKIHDVIGFLALIVLIVSLSPQAFATQYVQAQKNYGVQGVGWFKTGPEAATAMAQHMCQSGMKDCTGDFTKEAWDTYSNGWNWQAVFSYTNVGSGLRYSYNIAGSIHYECPAFWTSNESITPVKCQKNDDPTPCPTCPDPRTTPAVGNPVLVAGGLKTQSETDYENASGTLRFVRTYRSDDGLWRHNYQIVGVDRTQSDLTQVNQFACYYAYNSFTNGMWCFPYLGNGSTTFNFGVRRGAGRIINFGTATDYAPPADINDRASPIVDESNNRTGWRVANSANDSVEIYDLKGYLQTITARNGQVTTFSYSDAATPAEIAPVPGLLLRVTDPFGAFLSFTYNALGQMATMVDPAGNTTTYEYNGSGNLVKVTYPDGKSKTYVYNELDNTSKRAQINLLTGIIDENNSRFATFTYGVDRRGLSTEHAGGVERFSLAYPDASSTSVTDPLKANYSYVYTNTVGVLRLAYVIRPAASGTGTVTATTSYDMNANVSSYKDFDGTKTVYTYDLPRNLETKRVEASGTTTARAISTEWHETYRVPKRIAEPLRLTTYTHDTAGNVLTKTVQATTDATGVQGFNATLTGTARTWTYTYSQQGQLLTVKGPRTDLNDTTTYTYDEHGNLATISNALGHVTTLSNYDAHGHVGRVTDANGLVTDFSYTLRGWLSSTTVGNATTSYTYDNAGQLTGVSMPGGATLSYTYDAAHRLTAIADNAGNSIVYALDAIGNRTTEQVKDSSGTLTRQIARVYDPLNRLKQITGALQ